MLFKELIAGCCQSHTKHMNALRGQNVECLMLKQEKHDNHLFVKGQLLYGAVWIGK